MKVASAMIDQDIGGRIRDAREHRGLSLNDAATSTKLSTSVIRAIERNDFTRLPEGMYRKAYLRTLAAEVGLDANEIAADYDASHQPLALSLSGSAADATQDKWIEQLTPSPRRAIVTLAIFATLTAGWCRLQPNAASSHSDAANPEERSAGTRVATSRELPGAPLEIGGDAWRSR